MLKWQKYHYDTLNKPVSKLVKEVLEKDKNIKSAIDLGCGAGNETVFLIKNNISTIAIDKVLEKEMILSRLNKEEQKLLTLKEAKFQDIDLPSTDLVFAGCSIPFCNPNHFENLWLKIKTAINKNGYFVGQFFGNRDGWINNRSMTFFSRHNSLNHFKEFEIILFEEIEYDEQIKRKKHWHYFDIIAKKK